MTAIDHIPTHVAIIMDGNGRWAEQRGLPRFEGHRVGTENGRRIIEAFDEYGVRYLTLYAFSTENWARPRSEIQGLFQLMGEVIDRGTESLHRKGIRIRHLGKLDGLPPELRQEILRAIKLTENNTGMTLNIAFDYGGRAEIINAIQQIIRDGIAPEDINQDLLDSYLYTAGLPDPDLIIRTAGEMRLSNFLVWQGAYSEYYFTPVYWPDFDREEVRKALVAYSQRERRFGGLNPKVTNVILGGDICHP